LLDKTGTVTTGTMSLVDVVTADGVDRDEALRLVGSLEHASEHPVARAIAAAAARTAPLAPVESFRNRDGLGVEGAVDGHAIVAGRPALLAEWGIELPDELAAALEAGATGYLTADSDVDDLVECLRAVVDGETFIPACMLGGLLGRYIVQRRLQRDALARTSQLTRRERQVLWLLAQGLDTKGIARELVISPETARTHAQNVLGKLGVHSRLEAAALVSESGILDHLSFDGSGGDGR
jgi:cation transport ATPase